MGCDRSLCPGTGAALAKVRHRAIPWIRCGLGSEAEDRGFPFPDLEWPWPVAQPLVRTHTAQTRRGPLSSAPPFPWQCRPDKLFTVGGVESLPQTTP